ncbi:hypothetical protein PIGHUM_03629 [Pigmentiphaga humi]|uniref:Uncharacterized protein n=1 Tax=Pigmentiphaga humi TaxID=2478468 RepID=A0A3P4B5H0_9BURK|nr:hypothetical protein PIGHUM_03629 [Pigmentiphaga humi]
MRMSMVVLLATMSVSGGRWLRLAVPMFRVRMCTMTMLIVGGHLVRITQSQAHLSHRGENLGLRRALAIELDVNAPRCARGGF